MGNQTVNEHEIVMTEVQIWPLRKGDNSRVKAMVSITFNHALRVSGCRIIEGAKGLFLSYPSQKNPGSDLWFSLFMPLDRTLEAKINDEVIERFKSMVAAPYTDIRG